MRMLLLILLAVPCFAGGPKYGHESAKLDDEFVNVYHDISYPKIINGKAHKLNVGQMEAETLNTKNINGTFIGIGRNRIINGGMVVDQVNEGAAVTVNSNSTFFSVDQFAGIGTASAGIFTLQQQTSTPPTGFTHYLRATCTTSDGTIASGTRYFIQNPIEGLNVRDFLFGSASAKIVTLSFWVRSSLTGTYTGAFRNNSVNRSYPFEYTINSADTWEKKSITVSGDATGTWLATTGIGVNVNFALALGSNAHGTANTWNAANNTGTSNQVNFMSSSSGRTWDITGVQLEIGSTASEFEHRLFSVELMLCQRYYEKTFSAGVAVAQNSGSLLSALFYRIQVTGATSSGVMWRFATPKRAAPTMTAYNPSATNATWRNTSDSADSGTASFNSIGSVGTFVTNPQVAGDGAGESCQVHATADARL